MSLIFCQIAKFPGFTKEKVTKRMSLTKIFAVALIAMLLLAQIEAVPHEWWMDKLCPHPAYLRPKALNSNGDAMRFTMRMQLRNVKIVPLDLCTSSNGWRMEKLSHEKICQDFEPSFDY